jgi:hypothetical protein
MTIERDQTRRHFVHDCGVGVGSMALANLLAEDSVSAGSAIASSGPQCHFPAKAKRVIYLFMAGGPSQLELFEKKPQLQKMNGEVAPGFFFLTKTRASPSSKREPLYWERNVDFGGTVNVECKSANCCLTWVPLPMI